MKTRHMNKFDKINKMKRGRSYSSFKSGNTKKRRIKAPKRTYPKTNLNKSSYIGVNKKYVDAYNVGQAITSPIDATGGEIDVLVGGVSQSHFTPTLRGVGETNRVGDEIRVLSLQVNGTVTCDAQANQTSSDIGTKIMIALVLDTQTNAAAINSEDVYINPSFTASNAASPLRDMERSKRYKVIKTWDMTFNNPSITYDGTNIEQSGMVQPFDCFLNTDIVQQYSGTNSIITSVSDNSIQMIAFASSTALAPTIQFNTRCRFIDT